MYLEAFDKKGELLRRVRAADGSEDGQIESLFADKKVGRVHIRNAVAGCFIAAIENG